jgi:dehydrogenase/reductase SDR family protein 7
MELFCEYGYKYYPYFLTAGFGFFFSRMDCDMTLWYYSKLGKSPSILKDKVVWITGSSSGIGESLAYLFAGVGCKLILCGTRSERLQTVKKQCHSLNPSLQDKDVLALQFDMKDIDSMPGIFENVLKQFGKVDILVNNAGRSQRAAFEETELAVDRDMFEVNVFGLIRLTRLIVKHWYESNFPGQIAVTSSVAGKVGAPYSCTYTASKHALHGYFESLRNESYCRGIRITMVCPGPVVSEITERAYTSNINRTWGKKHAADEKRMATSRCAFLMGVAIANKLDEVWISKQPFLLYYYMSQYLPSFTRNWFPKVMTKERIMKLRDGKDEL